MHPSFSPVRRRSLLPAAAALALGLTACSGASVEPAENFGTFDEVLAAAQGQTVDLWMFGGDAKGNAYVDDILAPAAQDQGVTLRRVPIADTPDALNRVLSELQAGRGDGSVDLI
ncbi:hypothetical protein [Arthrobacter sp. H20]|uniref:hypothetical protein n=1 Tax=Arthrobacter sp. H20 TaxID=1267981 RepID=UPI0004B54669|nr:hypothetical protein [Arthrobacter sp. H20]